MRRSVRPGAASTSCPISWSTRTLAQRNPCSETSFCRRSASSSGVPLRLMLEAYIGTESRTCLPSSLWTGCPVTLPSRSPQRGVHAAQRPEQERTEELVLAPQAVVDQRLQVPGAAQEERGHHGMEDLNRLLGME